MTKFFFSDTYYSMKKSSLIVAPSVLSANFSRMGEAVALIEKSGAEWVHLDVMDGEFVPNITFGPKLINDLRNQTELYFDTHLMITKPERFISDFAEAGSDSITVHYESTVHLHRLIQQIRSLDKRPGISIVPSTPVELLEQLLPELDQVLVMTVNPGFGGQSLIPFCIEKVRKLRKLCDRLNPDCRICVDGGVNASTIGILKEAGIDVAVAGSAFFNAESPADFVSMLKQA